jgi:hypothetical protein
MNRPACTLSSIVVAFLVSACAGNPPQPPSSPVTRIPDAGGWFCQMNAAGNGWECVQDPLLARTPRPERLPQPSAAPEQRTDSADEAPSQPPFPEEPPLSEDSPFPEEPPLSEDSPFPEEPVPPGYSSDLAELPGHYYAVQLIAMPSAAALRRFVDQHNLTGTTSVVVERDGGLFHVLLLGIYEDAATARQAAATLPADLQESEPWIRRVASLQSASLRANAVAGADGS